MRTIVTYKDRDGKRRQKSVPISPFTEINQTVREFVNYMRLSPRTYIYNVKQGATTYIWKSLAYDAFTPEQIKDYPYWR